MVRVPLNRSLDVSDAAKLLSEFIRYKNEVAKDPNYGSKRSAREARQRAYREKKRLQQESGKQK
jgi:hypothetical protein